MRSYTVEGIIIKRRNFGESDRILTVFTKDHGKIQVKALGVRKITSRRSAHTELLNLSLLTLHRTSGMSILTEATHMELFEEIKNDLKKIMIAYHLCELIDGLCPDNQENCSVFFLFKNVLDTISQEKNIFQTIRKFEFDLLETLGYISKKHMTVSVNPSFFIEDILERKLKTRQMLPRLL